MLGLRGHVSANMSINGDVGFSQVQVFTAELCVRLDMKRSGTGVKMCVDVRRAKVHIGSGSSRSGVQSYWEASYRRPIGARCHSIM
jgi:hypothetical protein